MKKIKKPSELFALFEEINLYSNYGIKRIGIFGSFARGESFRDIDLYIEDEIEFSKLLELKSTLEALVGVQFDIMTQKDAEPVILYRATKDMKYATAN